MAGNGARIGAEGALCGMQALTKIALESYCLLKVGNFQTRLTRAGPYPCIKERMEGDKMGTSAETVGDSVRTVDEPAAQVQSTRKADAGCRQQKGWLWYRANSL